MTSAQQSSQRSRRNLLILLVVVLFFALLWWAWWFFVGRGRVESNDAYVTGNIIPVPAQAAGTIRRVYVENTQRVHAGQLLAAVQGDRSRLAMTAAAAHLGSTVRKVRQEFAKVEELRQEIRAQDLQVQKLQEDLQRYRQAEQSGSVAAIRISNTQKDIASLQAKIQAQKAHLAAVSALVDHTTLQSNPQVQAAVTAFAQSYIDWLRREVRAPVSGYIAQRAVQAGQRVHPGERLFSIVPLKPLWVVANIKETEMAQVRPGQRVTLESYYYGSSVSYHGIVQGLLPGAGSAFSILPPENATGNYIHIVERVPVRISLPAKELARYPLRPGLSMVVKIHVSDHHTQSVLQPLTQTPVSGYETSLYASDLRKAMHAAEKIIQNNAGQKIPKS